jgi:IclR family pca regulon transcriptional regulator
VAAPIRDHTGHVVAAINVATNVSRHRREELVRDIVPPLLATAEHIAQDLVQRPRHTAAGATRRAASDLVGGRPTRRRVPKP